MNRFFIFFLLFLFSCDKGSDLIIEETAFPEIAEVYLLNDLDPNFVFPENLQYMASNGVNSSVCIDISENFYSQYGSGFAPMQSAAARNTSVALDRPLKTHTCHSDYNRRNVSIGGQAVSIRIRVLRFPKFPMENLAFLFTMFVWK